jgi:hypothetical protein
MKDKNRNFNAILGIVVIACLFTGLAGLLGALFASFNYNWIGVGICVGAAALSFGLLANAILRE